MRVSFKWLNEFVDTGISAQETARRLTMIGLEVESLELIDGDTVFEVNVTPNRPDCLSMLGIARELSASLDKPVRLPDYKITTEQPTGFKVEISDESLCGRYAGRVIRGVKISPSPDWMSKRLERCGIRAINNIVDATNYVLLEFGHPLHAFDLDALKGNIIRVDTARDIDKITTLDGVERKLKPDALLIWDGLRPVALAGIMGGGETEVAGSTKNIFLEAAHFNPVSIRRTSRALGLGTEASYRFERGIDIEMLEAALDRASYLIAEIAGGKIEKKADAYPRKFRAVEILAKCEKVNRILGTDISSKEMAGMLRRLHLNVTGGEGTLKVIPPPFRLDIKNDSDIIEEVARLYGYEKIPTAIPRSDISKGGISRKRRLISVIKESMRKAGFNEAVNMSFMNEDYFGILDIPGSDGRRRAVALLNPLRKEEALLRTMLAPSLLENLIYNASHDIRDVRLFEISKVFEDTGSVLPHEQWRLGGIYFKEKTPSFYREDAAAFYIVKGAIESLFDELKITDLSFTLSDEPFLHAGQSADIHISGKKAGFLGALSPETIERVGLKTKSGVIIFDLGIDDIIKAAPSSIRYKPAPKFPHIERDMAIILDAGIRAGDVINIIKGYPSEFIEEIAVFDLYKGPNIPGGKKSLAFSIRYRASNKTLTDEEVDAVHKSIVEHIIKETGGQLR
jgi:phenylalanyl-tRNA synthetase beta chain